MKKVIGINQQQIIVRHLTSTDDERLFQYFTGLSAETKSRFGPHPFDRETVHAVCYGASEEVLRYIALNETDDVIAYMLLKDGINDGELYRLRQNDFPFSEGAICSFAPSVADAWQHAGLGSAMFKLIEEQIRNTGKYHCIVLWGGVQATNEKAVNFYKKHGFQHAGSFWHDGKDNYDMVKSLLG